MYNVYIPMYIYEYVHAGIQYFSMVGVWLYTYKNKND